MKHKLFTLCCIAITVFVFTSCKANYPIAQQGGKDDVAYLLFESSKNKSYQIDVTIDNTTTFTAKTIKTKDSKNKGTSYAVKTGKRRIKVLKDGINIYEKYLFLSPQETKIITLQ